MAFRVYVCLRWHIRHDSSSFYSRKLTSFNYFVAICSQSGRRDTSACFQHSTLTNCSSSMKMRCNGPGTPGVQTKNMVNMHNFTPLHHANQQASSFVTTYHNSFKTQSTVRNPYLKTTGFGTHPIIRNPYLKTPRTSYCPPQNTSISKPKELFQGSPWNMVCEKLPFLFVKRLFISFHKFFHMDHGILFTF